MIDETNIAAARGVNEQRQPPPAAAPPPAIESAPRLHPSGLMGPSLEELGAGAMSPSIRRGAFNPSEHLADWTGVTSARGIDPGNLSQAQIEQDIQARGLLNAKTEAELASIRQQAGRDPQEEGLAAIERTARYENLMPDIERPLRGEDGAFSERGGVFSNAPTLPRVRGQVAAPLELYRGQRAIDRGEIEARGEDFRAAVGDLQEKANRAMARVEQDPTLSALAKKEQVADLQATLEKEVADLRATHGYTERGVGGAFTGLGRQSR